MSTRMVILGLLRERPLHGYEIKQIIEERMGDWTSIAFGSIYFALGKLAEEGFIEKTAEEQEGNRPSRSIYAVTPAGRTEFERLLRQTWSNVERPFYDIDLGLYFMPALPPEEIAGYLRARLAQLDQNLQYVSEHRAAQLARGVPRLAAAIFDHSLLHLQAERRWTADLLAQVEGETLP